MKRRDFLKTAGLMTVGTFALHELLLGKGFTSRTMSGTLNSGKKPNIIFILADDLGYGEISCYGADNYKTPHIDKLAHGGTRFTHAYTPSLCGPSRATILTGRYGFRTGGSNQDAVGKIRPKNETLTASVLKSAGYATSMVGKWSQFKPDPSEFGFDDNMRFPGSGKYWNTQKKFKSYLLNGVDTPLQDNEYMPDVMHKHVVEFMTKHRDEPFFIHYAMSHIHSEILRTPDSKPATHDYYADNIVYMDKLVGELVAEVDRLKLRDNTILIFFSDNGAVGSYSSTATIGGKALSGCKGTMLEGGSIEPLIVNWPGVTPVGKVNDDLIDSSDFLTTFAEIAGAKVPQERVHDGRSFCPQIKGKKGNPRDWVFIQLGNNWYVREKSWKLTQDGDLFDMSKAPFEEIAVPKETTKPEAIAARKRLQDALDQLNPASGILDSGDGSGRHANKAKKNKKDKMDKSDKKVKQNKKDKKNVDAVEDKDTD